MSNLQITASFSGGSLTVSGSGWPAGGTVTIQMTDSTGFSVSPQCTADDGGAFTYTSGDPCKAAGEFKVAATNGLPQPGAEYNYEWSNIVTLMCAGPAPGAEEPPDTPDTPETPEDPGGGDPGAGGGEEGAYAPEPGYDVDAGYGEASDEGEGW